MKEKFEKFELEVSTLEVKPNLIKSDGPEVVTGDGKKSKIRILINVDDDNDNSPIFIPSESSLLPIWLLPKHSFNTEQISPP